MTIDPILFLISIYNVDLLIVLSPKLLSLHRHYFSKTFNKIQNNETMGLFDFLFKSKEERAKEKRVYDVLKRTDDFIERTEKMLDEMKKDDERWRRGL